MVSFLGQVQIAVEAMSNLRPKTTGLKGIVLWVSAGEFEGKQSPHGPRVKVIIGNSRVTQESLAKAPSVRIQDGALIQGELKPKQLKEVQDFLAANKSVLLKYWRQAIDTADMVSMLKKL